MQPEVDPAGPLMPTANSPKAAATAVAVEFSGRLRRPPHGCDTFRRATAPPAPTPCSRCPAFERTRQRVATRPSAPTIGWRARAVPLGNIPCRPLSDASEDRATFLWHYSCVWFQHHLGKELSSGYSTDLGTVHRSGCADGALSAIGAGKLTDGRARAHLNSNGRATNGSATPVRHPPGAALRN